MHSPARLLFSSTSSFSLLGIFLTAIFFLATPLTAQQKAPAKAPAKETAKEIEVPPPPSVQADVSQVEFDSIVRIEVEVENRNYRVPWNIGGLGSGVGTGFLIGENRFLTNAHVVSNRRLIYIKKMDRPEPYEARVLFVAHDCDLALLELKDPAPFKDVKPLSLGNIPKLNTTVIAVGYPIGGERISVTRGVVSRIDFRPYTHSGVDFHLTIQVDAAINPGNSGGPVLQENKVVGVAFQGYSGSQAQNTAYMIPVPVINRFLKDVADGHYDHYVDMATQTINLLNPAQRLALGLKNDGRGVMVTVADKAGSAGGILKTGDVLLSIDGFDIASDGFVTIEGERINLNEIVERKFVGDTVTLKILRDLKEQEIKVELQRFIPYLIQANHYDQKPNFVLFAGLQFQPLDRELMASFKIDDLKARYIYGYFSRDELYLERPEPVVLTAVLPDSVNTLLQPYTNQIVDMVNGKKILTLQDVYDALNSDTHEEGQEDYHVIRLLGEGRPLVMERAKAKAAHQRIMDQYNVGYDHFIEKPLILQTKALAEPTNKVEKK
jgi:S1-C subfamily serine protease